MLARLHILMPFHLTVPDNTPFDGHGVELADGCAVRFYPPGRSDLSLPPDLPDVLIDGRPAFRGDALRLDFVKANFDRREASELDPPVETIQHLLNWFVSRLRYVIQAPQMPSINFPEVAWRLEYLNDDESALPEEKGMLRGRGALKFEYSYMVMTPQIWSDVFNLPLEFETPPWEELLLDARAALPNLGPALVLAATALEVLISTSLDKLAERKGVSPTLWRWITDRDFHLRDPSVEEQYDVLLKELTGKSLKDDLSLWQSFISLKKARNSFVHSGQLLIDKILVTPDTARNLIASAGQITEFVKALLPEELRWPKFAYTIPLTLTQHIRRESKADSKTAS